MHLLFEGYTVLHQEPSYSKLKDAQEKSKMFPKKKPKEEITKREAGSSVVLHGNYKM